MKASVLTALIFVVVALSCQQYDQLKASVSKDWGKMTGASGTGGGSSGDWTHVDAPDAGVAEDALSGTCILPTHTDEYSAFTIGHPTGWLLDFSTDTIIVAKDESQTEGALVFPARLRRTDIPPERLATLFAEGLGRSIARKGGTSELTEKRTDGRAATAVILATIGGVQLKGPLQVVESPGFVTLKLYWAPKDAFDAEEPTLKQILTCFKRETILPARVARRTAAPPPNRVTRVGFQTPPAAGTPGAPATPSSATSSTTSSAAVLPLKPYPGRYMHAQLPDGWKVTTEIENGIDVIAPNNAGHVGFGWFANPQRFQDPASLLRAELAKHPGAKIVKEGQVAGPPGWVIFEAEYESGPAHIYTRFANGRGISISHGWDAPVGAWSNLRPTFEAVLASIEIQPAAVAKTQADVRAQLASYPHPKPPVYLSDRPSSSSGSNDLMSSWQKREAAQDQANQGMDDYIRGQEWVKDSSGTTFPAPTSAWNATGPQGAGYYKATPGGGAELLQQVQGPND